MNIELIEMLMDKHYECRKLLQEAKEAEHNRREQLIYLNHQVDKNNLDLVRHYQRSAQRWENTRDEKVGLYTLKFKELSEPLIPELVEADNNYLEYEQA